MMADMRGVVSCRSIVRHKARCRSDNFIARSLYTIGLMRHIEEGVVLAGKLNAEIGSK